MIRAIKRLYAYLAPLPPLPPEPHKCEFHIVSERPHFWKFVNGKASGMHSSLDEKSILFAKEQIDKKGNLPYLVENFQNLIKWRRAGYNAYHTSMRLHLCECGSGFREEVYVEPTIVERQKLLTL